MGLLIVLLLLALVIGSGSGKIFVELLKFIFWLVVLFIGLALMFG